MIFHSYVTVYQRVYRCLFNTKWASIHANPIRDTPTYHRTYQWSPGTGRTVARFDIKHDNSKYSYISTCKKKWPVTGSLLNAQKKSHNFSCVDYFSPDYPMTSFDIPWQGAQAISVCTTCGCLNHLPWSFHPAVLYLWKLFTTTLMLWKTYVQVIIYNIYIYIEKNIKIIYIYYIYVIFWWFIYRV